MARMLQENVVTYKTPALAYIFHSFPHLNVSGHHVNSAFAPRSELYLEVSDRSTLLLDVVFCNFVSGFSHLVFWVQFLLFGW